MRKFYKLRTFLLFFLLTVSWGMRGQETVTFTIKSTTSVTASTSISGMSAVFKNTYNQTAEQITKSNSMTLTIKGYPYNLGSVILNMKTNASAGTGNINITVGGNSFNSGTYAKLCGVNSSTYKDYVIGGNQGLSGDIVIKIACTTNSLYCTSFTIVPVADSRPELSMNFEKPTPQLDLFSKEFQNPLSIKKGEEVLTDIPVVYTSSDKTVATVDPVSGIVKPFKHGSTTITATVEETETYQGATASYELTVTAPKPVVSFETEKETVDVKEKLFAKPAKVLLDNEITTKYVVKYSSSDETLATVDQNGIVSLKAVGTTVITGKIEETAFNLAAEDSYVLNISAPQAIMTFEHAEIVKLRSETDPFINPVTILFDGKPLEDETPLIEYASSSSSVASVDESTGKVTPKSLGTTTITAVLKNGAFYAGDTTSYILKVEKGPAVLPFKFNGLLSTIAAQDGLSQKGVASASSSNSNLRWGFNTKNDEIVLHFSDYPGTLSFYMQLSSFKGVFQIQESDNGTDYVTIKEYKSASLSPSLVTIAETEMKRSTRYIRWIATDCTGGQVNMGNIVLTKGYAVGVPIFSAPESTEFLESALVELGCETDGSIIYYTLDESIPSDASSKYEDGIFIDKTTTVKAVAYKGRDQSPVVEKTYTRIYPEVILSEAEIVYPSLNVFDQKETASKTLIVETNNLLGDVEINITGRGFSCDKQIIAKDSAKTQLNISFDPKLAGRYQGVIVFEGSGFKERIELPLTGQAIVDPKETIWEEKFDFIKTGNGTLIDSLKNRGWSGFHLYGGKSAELNTLRIGSGSNAGQACLPVFDLSNTAYDYFLSFDALQYSATEKKMNFLLKEDGDPIPLMLSGNWQTFTYPLEWTNTSSICFFGLGADNRFYLDNIRIQRVPKVLSCQISGETSYEDLNARLALDGLTSVTFKQPVSFIDQGTINAPANPNCLLYTSTDLGFTQNQVLNGECEYLILSDNHPFGAPDSFVVTNVTYSRQAYQDGLWETIVLPYDVKESEMPKEYEFAKYDGLTADKNGVVFAEVKALTAHTAYLMRYVGANKTNGTALCSFESMNANIGGKIEAAEFVGVYARTETEGKWLLNVKNGVSVFQKGLPGSAINPFRAYLDLVVADAARMRIVHRPADATSLDGALLAEEWWLRSGSQGELIVTTREAMTLRIVAIDGRVLRVVSVDAGETRIAQLPAGICIVNGKKGIVR